VADTVFDRQRVERGRLLEYLRTLTESAFEQPSLCADYRVRDVVGHLIGGAKSTPPRFLADLARARFDFHRAMRAAADRNSGGTAEDLVRRFESVQGARARPGTSLLAEIVVHAEDIRRPLGAGPAEYDPTTLRLVADHCVKAGGPIGAKKRVAGLRLQATDQDWSSGEGPVLSGPLLSLVLAMTGRPVAHSDLSGAGLDTLAGRS